MSKEYLNKTGLTYFWGKIKSSFLTDVEFNSSTNYITKTKNGTTSNVVQIPSGVSPSSTTPAMDGTAATGSETAFARGDHVHPTDTSRAASSHNHGNINTSGTLQVNPVTIENGDQLVIVDGSNQDKVAKSSVQFDGSTTTQALTKKGTWETFLTSTSVGAASGLCPLDANSKVDGTYLNLKTINNESIIGSGNIVISSGAGGTVTSVGITNATNGGLTVSDSPITSSGNISVGHSNVLSSAQTTQALYPIEIDKNGHISAYGTAVTSLPASDVSAWAKASTKPTYTASEVGALPDTTEIPTKVSDLMNDSGFTSNTGTVTSVGVSNATNGGLSVSGSPITSSGSITVGHTNVLTSEQTTEAVYPVKIDKNGHISSYGSAVTSMPASDVYSWAKASTKPSYTASEVGAQETLVSGTNIKTINNQTLLGSGNINIGGGSGGGVNVNINDHELIFSL